MCSSKRKLNNSEMMQSCKESEYHTEITFPQTLIPSKLSMTGVVFEPFIIFLDKIESEMMFVL